MSVLIENTDFQGWPHSYRISNGTVEAIVTGDVGPRVMRYGFVGGQNLFKEALVHRRARLQHWLAKIQEPLLVYSDGVVGSGQEFFAQVVARGHGMRGRVALHRPGLPRFEGPDARALSTAAGSPAASAAAGALSAARSLG